MLVTRKGLETAERKRAEYAQKLHDANAAAAEAYELGGDAWHDNPGFRDTDLARKSLMLEAREFENRLRGARAIDTFHFDGTVSPGSVVTIRYQDGEEWTITVLGPLESDPDNGIISNEAPLAIALIGKAHGDKISFDEDIIEILSVSPWKE